MIMVQEAEEKSIQTRWVGNLPSSDLPPALANTQAANEQPTRNVPNANAVISIGVIDEHSFTRECITKSLQEICKLLDVTSFTTCDECLQNKSTYDLILYHAHESVAARDDDGERLASVKKVLEIAPVIILCDVDCLDSIIAAFESGVRGYIPTASTTLELTIEIMRLVRAGGTFVPPSSLSLRRITKQGQTAQAIPTHQFTPRQIAVLEHLKLGKSNKMIAHELEMSASTVKVHIRNIMKKMKVTNRTEAACLALTPRRQPED
jgi:DNA-binding NarL/FixJ family response regulator